MRIGDMDRRITFQYPSVVKDAYGAETVTWIPFKTVWAQVTPGQSREFFAAQVVNAKLTHEFLIRYMAGITPDMRIVFRGRVFNIDPPRNPGEKDKELRIMAAEFVSPRWKSTE